MFIGYSMIRLTKPQSKMQQKCIKNLVTSWSASGLKSFQSCFFKVKIGILEMVYYPNYPWLSETGSKRICVISLCVVANANVRGKPGQKSLDCIY